MALLWVGASFSASSAESRPILLRCLNESTIVWGHVPAMRRTVCLCGLHRTRFGVSGRHTGVARSPTHAKAMRKTRSGSSLKRPISRTELKQVGRGVGRSARARRSFRRIHHPNLRLTIRAHHPSCSPFRTGSYEGGLMKRAVVGVALALGVTSLGNAQTIQWEPVTSGV